MKSTYHALAIPIALLSFAGLAGCAINTPMRGWVPATHGGATASEPDVIDEHGEEKKFSNLLGDYSVLALTRCDQDTHGGVIQLLERIVDENRGA